MKSPVVDDTVALTSELERPNVTAGPPTFTGPVAESSLSLASLALPGYIHTHTETSFPLNQDQSARL